MDYSKIKYGDGAVIVWGELILMSEPCVRAMLLLLLDPDLQEKAAQEMLSKIFLHCPYG